MNCGQADAVTFVGADPKVVGGYSGVLPVSDLSSMMAPPSPWNAPTCHRHRGDTSSETPGRDGFVLRA